MRGASEFILIDQMTHACVMQIYWTEEAMKRAIREPRTESHEFRRWARQFANIRLVSPKTAKTQRRNRAGALKPAKVV